MIIYYSFPVICMHVSVNTMGVKIIFSRGDNVGLFLTLFRLP